jgi:YesN/AraC family two-component response regulator
VTAALAWVRADPQRFDLVITDMTMPEMTGMDLATRLQEIRTDLPIILTSGYSANLTAERTRALGISEMLMKPHTIHALAMAVQRALG